MGELPVLFGSDRPRDTAIRDRDPDPRVRRILLWHAGRLWDLFDWRLESYPPELEQYVGAGIEVRLYGDWTCELTEGCALFVNRFDLEPCGVVPLEPSSWGAIKSGYK